MYILLYHSLTILWYKLACTDNPFGFADDHRLSNFWFSIKLGPLSTNKLKTGFASPSKQTQGFWAESVENIFV